MLFSVVTVTRDNLDGLKRTRASLREQSCRNFSWIVIDGASGDGTVDYLQDADFGWISAADSGIYDAMNKGIARAQGDYLLFLNAGDALAGTDVLQKLSDAIAAQKKAPDFVYGDALEGNAPHYKTARFHEKYVRGMFTHHQAMLYRRESIGDLRYDTSYRIAADYKFTVSFLKRSKNILYCPFPVCLFESGGISQQSAGPGRREQYRARRELRVAGVLQCMAIYAGQSFILQIRRLFPGLYWRVKKKESPINL